MPESRCDSSTGLRPAAGRLFGGAGGVGFDLAAGGAGGSRAVGAGVGATCSSTYAAGIQAWPAAFFANHQPSNHVSK